MSTTYQLMFGRRVQFDGSITDEGFNESVIRFDIAQEDFDDFLANAVGTVFPHFTVTEGTGRWKGRMERMWIVTIITNGDSAGQIHQIAKQYAEDFAQDSVLVNSFNSEYLIVQRTQ